jgi:hypothetical protein
MVTLSIMEIYLRLTGLSLPSYVYDDKKLGRTHNPNKEIFEVKAEGFCIDRVNKFGYIGSEYPNERKPETIRIALLGSSFVEGVQVFYRNRFSYVFESELSKKLNKKVEVLNFAIGGDDFRGMYLRYNDLVLKYNPDYTFFMVKPSDFSRKKSIPAPELTLHNNSLAINYDFLKSSESATREKFSLLREYGVGNFLKEAYEVYYTGRLTGIILDKLDFIKAKEERSTIQGDKYSHFEINKRVMDELLKENIHTQNQCIIVDMDGFQEKYQTYIDSMGLSYLDISKPLKKFTEPELMYWKASRKMGHWNNFANKKVGEILSEQFYEFLDKKINYKQY